MTTKTSKTTKINSLPLCNCFEVLRIYENKNYYVENKNGDTTERTIISGCNSKKIHKGTNTQFVNQISGEWFFHSDGINQNPTVVPSNRSYEGTTKYFGKVFVFRDLFGNINRKVFSNSLPKFRSRLKYLSRAIRKKP